MSDFGKKVSDLYREIKDTVNNKGIDREIKEQVHSDMDGLIKKHCSFQGTAFLLRIDPLKRLNRRSRAGPGNMDCR